MKNLARIPKIVPAMLLITLLAGAAIPNGRQHTPKPEAVSHLSHCYSGNGKNALTIALPTDASHHLTAVYIRRKGCPQWSQNLGVVLPGMSIHILNLDDGEIEVFWRKDAHTFGVRPALEETPPTKTEWSTVLTTNDGGDTLELSAEIHRRIVIQ